MLLRYLTLAVVALAFLDVLATVSHAQKSKKPVSSRRDEQRENQAVKQAQEDVKAAEKTIHEREQQVRERLMQLRAAQQARQSAASRLQKVEDRLEQEHAEATGLSQAREKLKAILAELDSQSKPVLEQLRQQPDYKAAQEAWERAKAALKPDPDHPETDRRAAVAAHAKAAQQVRALEQAALERVDSLKTLLGQRDSAEAAVQLAKKQFDRAVEKDPDMAAARQAFEKAKQEEERAEVAVAEAQRKAADAREQLAQARQKLQQKIAADLKDNNQGKNKNNKKNK